MVKRPPSSPSSSKTIPLPELDDLPDLPDLALTRRKSTRLSINKSNDLIHQIQKKRNLQEVWACFDFDSFSVNCHLLKHPEFKTRPCVVIRISKEGQKTVLSSNDVARTLVDKEQRCLEVYERVFGDKLKVFEQDSSLQYQKARHLKEISTQYDPFFESKGIDEVCINLTKWIKNSNAIDLVKQIRKKIEDKTQLKVSCGVGPTTYLSKMAANQSKSVKIGDNKGIFVINNNRSEILAFLGEKEVKDLHGVGKSFGPRMNTINIFTGKDILMKADELSKIFTKVEEIKFIHYALGIEPSQGSKTKTSQAWFYSMETKKDIEKEISRLVEYFQHFLKRNKYVTNGLKIVLTNKDDQDVVKGGKNLDHYFDDKKGLMESIEEVFGKIKEGMNLTHIQVKCSKLVADGEGQEKIKAKKTKRITKTEIEKSLKKQKSDNDEEDKTRKKRPRQKKQTK